MIKDVSIYVRIRKVNEQMFYNKEHYIGNAYKVEAISQEEYRCIGLSDKFRIIKKDCEIVKIDIHV